GISSVRSGGLTPRLLPSTRISPQGATASSTRASSAEDADLSFARSGFFSRRATSFLSNLPSTAAPAFCAGADDSSMVLAATAAQAERPHAGEPAAVARLHHRFGLRDAARHRRAADDRVHLVLAHVLVGARALVVEQIHVVARQARHDLVERARHQELA